MSSDDRAQKGSVVDLLACGSRLVQVSRGRAGRKGQADLVDSRMSGLAPVVGIRGQGLLVVDDPEQRLT